MPVWSMSTFVRCAWSPPRAGPILFEHPELRASLAVSAPDVRPMHAWEFFDDAGREAATWADEMRRGDAASWACRTGHVASVDRLGHARLPRARRGAASDPAGLGAGHARRRARSRRRRRSRLFELNGELVVEMLDGVRGRGRAGHPRTRASRDPLGRRCFEAAASTSPRTRCARDRTRIPWRAEATDRVLEPGDLVFVDTDTVGIEGYFFCVSSTFPCGERPPAGAQRELYRAALRVAAGHEGLIRPGLTCGELAASAPPLPEKYLGPAVRVHDPRHRPRGGEPERLPSRRSAAERRARRSREHGARGGALRGRGRRRPTA